MPEKNSISFKRVLLISLLIFGIFWKQCDSQAMREEANKPPEGRGGDGGAFFALQTCHQLLRGDTGDFFSPDYMCSNPPLWCNWTIQVDPAKRIHLHLEDLTPDDACHLKDDQVHVDEPAGHVLDTNVLQKCWRVAKYTSSSNTLYVVLLIGGWPTPPYRGFYGRYQSFGLPVVYNPQEGSPEPNRKSQPLPPGLMELNDLDLMYDYNNQPSDMTAEPPWEEEEARDTEMAENHPPALENNNRFTAAPSVGSSTQHTSRWGRGASQASSDPLDSAVPPQQEEDGQNLVLKPEPTEGIPTAAVEEASTHPEEAAEEESRTEESRTEESRTEESRTEESRTEESRTEESKTEESRTEESRTEVSEASDQLPVSEAPEPEPEETHPQPNMVEPLSDQRGHPRIRNHSELSHHPGDYLFEVAVEVNFRPDVEESWDNLAMSLLLSVEALISKQLEALHTPVSMSSERIKRLSAGALYILWLQLDQGPRGLQVHMTVHSALQGLMSTHVGVRGNSRKAVILSVSTADVDECVTQLVRCDVNADCVNRFGSYSCRCRPGFQDESHLGSAGTVCVDVNAAGCSSSSSLEASTFSSSCSARCCWCCWGPPA
ncbi:uncharacterized protein zgc:66455 isoform X1 [Eleginops maclovinus]|uniref:uncharacterized protein zgc:66455 isoform X1 n=1 Tax=Eleginops maclovinus TaxID=56733 RepID=UPI00307FD52B